RSYRYWAFCRDECRNGMLAGADICTLGPTTIVASFLDRYILNSTLHSFPTRRSSDLAHGGRRCTGRGARAARGRCRPRRGRATSDRKSTRLNSSHVEKSYAVFCLKKKNALPPRAVAAR